MHKQLIIKPIHRGYPGDYHPVETYRQKIWPTHFIDYQKTVDTTAEITQYLVDQVDQGNEHSGRNPSVKRRWRYIAELPIRYLRKSEDRHLWGRIDLAIQLQVGTAHDEWFAIEIDSQPNSNSIEKLRNAQEQGYTPVFIRWKTPVTDQERRQIPDDINLIELKLLEEPCHSISA